MKLLKSFGFTLVFALAVSFGAGTSLVHAENTDAVSKLKAQIQELMLKLQAMQNGGGNQNTGESGKPDTSVTKSYYCPSLNSVSLSRGLRDGGERGGSEVSELQKFLASYFNLDQEEIVTGYFGTITKGYVARFQKENNVEATGTIGELTRVAIAKHCGGVQSNSFINFISPKGSGVVVSAQSPVAVTWAPVNLNLQNKFKDFWIVLQIIDSNGREVGTIGDGYRITDTSVSWNIASNMSQGFYKLTPNAKYRIRATLQGAQSLMSGCDSAVTGECSPLYSDSVKQLMREAEKYTSYSDFVLFVSETQSSGSFSATPTSGKTPLTVTFNIPTASAGGDHFDFGDGYGTCSIPGVIRIGDGCTAPINTPFTHTYTKPGTYKVTHSRSLPSTVLGTTIITVTDNSSAYLTEQVKCVFSGSSTEQRCYAVVAPGSTSGEYGCSGVGSCTMTVGGQKGKITEWKSSCGTNARTIVDGIDKYANFSCSPTQTPTATIDQGSLAEFDTYPTFTGSAAGVMSIRLEISQISGTTLIQPKSVPVVNGRWSFKAGTEAPRGSYRVTVFEDIGPHDNMLAQAVYTTTSTSTTPILSIPGFGGQTYTAGDGFSFNVDYTNAKVGSWICASFTSNDKDFYQFPSSQSECGKTTSTNGKMTIQGKIMNNIPAGVYHLRAELYYSPTGQWGGQFPLATASSGSFYMLAASSVTPSATIDQGSLNQGKGLFNIIGSASNVKSLQIIMVTGNYTGATDWNSANAAVKANSIYNVNSTARVENGRWSGVFGNSNATGGVPNGTYTLLVYDLSNDTVIPRILPKLLTKATLTVKKPVPAIFSITPSSGPVGTEVIIRGTGFTGADTLRFGSGGKRLVTASENGTVIKFTIPTYVSACDLVPDSNTPCPPGAVLVYPSSWSVSISNANGSSPESVFVVTAPQSATIDQSSLYQSKGFFYITGSASNAKSLQIIMVTGNYTGATDWNSANAAVKANSIYNVNSTARVENGRWSGVFGNSNATGGVPDGTYTLLVFDLSNDGVTPSVLPKLLTRSMLTVKKPVPAIFSITPSSGPVGTEVIIRGTGFTGADTLRFGSGGKRLVTASENGTVIKFTIPTYVSACDLVPDSNTPCPPGAVLVYPSSWSVSISNANGSSPESVFVVTAPQSATTLTGSLTPHPNPCNITAGQTTCQPYFDWTTANTYQGSDGRVAFNIQNNAGTGTYATETIYAGRGNTAASGTNGAGAALTAGTYTLKLYGFSQGANTWVLLDSKIVTVKAPTTTVSALDQQRIDQLSSAISALKKLIDNLGR